MNATVNVKESDGARNSLRVIDAGGLDELIYALVADGFRVLGPTVRSGAIVYEELESVGDLPRGLRDETDGGKYRLMPREDQACFGFAVGPQSWKKYLFPAEQMLWRLRKSDSTFEVENDDAGAEKMAFVGVRSCELAAIDLQDRVFLEGTYVNESYRRRRDSTLIIAVNCTYASATCFCTSTGTGPGVSSGFDLALTEITGEGETLFVVVVGTDRGEELLGRVHTRPATDDHGAEAQKLTERTASSMRRHLKTDGLHDVLRENLDHPRWNHVAERCLACANCTLVCPTCFCTSMEDRKDVTGETSVRWQRWDSCFAKDFSYLHGGSVRQTTRSRYRQWLTHKLSFWVDQFGASGCVGCGRCIAWCPVGIDITEEANAILQASAVQEAGEVAGESQP